MKFKFRGQLKNSKEVVDIFEFDGRTAKCGDLKDRDIDDFNTIFYGAEKFKVEILKIINDDIDTSEEMVLLESKSSK